MGWLDNMRETVARWRAPVAPKGPEPTFAEEMAAEAEGFAAAMAALGWRADFTMDALEDLDKFFEEETGWGGILTGDCEGRLYGLAAYLGEVMRRACGAEWVRDDKGGVCLELPGGALRDPFYKVNCRARENDPVPFAVYAVRAIQGGN